MASFRACQLVPHECRHDVLKNHTLWEDTQHASGRDFPRQGIQGTQNKFKGPLEDQMRHFSTGFFYVLGGGTKVAGCIRFNIVALSAEQHQYEQTTRTRKST